METNYLLFATSTPSNFSVSSELPTKIKMMFLKYVLPMKIMNYMNTNFEI